MGTWGLAARKVLFVLRAGVENTRTVWRVTNALPLGKRLSVTTTSATMATGLLAVELKSLPSSERLIWEVMQSATLAVSYALFAARNVGWD